jgi:hypothetical protein
MTLGCRTSGYGECVERLPKGTVLSQGTRTGKLWSRRAGVFPEIDANDVLLACDYITSWTHLHGALYAVDGKVERLRGCSSASS